MQKEFAAIEVRWLSGSGGEVFNSANYHSYEFQVMDGQVAVFINGCWIRYPLMPLSTSSRGNTKYHKAIAQSMRSPHRYTVLLASRDRAATGEPKYYQQLEADFYLPITKLAIVNAASSAVDLSQWDIIDHWLSAA